MNPIRTQFKPSQRRAAQLAAAAKKENVRRIFEAEKKMRADINRIEVPDWGKLREDERAEQERRKDRFALVYFIVLPMLFSLVVCSVIFFAAN
jgi:hypothetical protein